MRCPDCNKFVAYNVDEEPEENSAAVDGVWFTAEYRRVLTCEECGTELKETTFELEHDFEDAVKALPPPDDGHEHEWELESSSCEPTMDLVTKDAKGRQIKSARYMKTLYGVSCDVEVKCSHEGCGAAIEFNVSDSCQASGMDELT